MPTRRVADCFQPSERPRCSLWLSALAFAIAAAHLALAPGYGYFRDEFYYLACSRHLAFGYVDHPPLIAAVTALVTSALGSSLYALRFVPALCAGAIAWLSGACAAELGARRFGQLAAALTLSIAPLIAAFCSFLSMNALDVVVWGLSFWLALRLLREATLMRWLSLGLVLGIGLENKLSVLWLGAGLAVGFIAYRRDLLRTRGPYLCAALALACLLPHVIWQARLGFPTLEFIHNARTLKM
ncbi:MAG TPA: glycosyltransferase family 39 protein, partial [Polyangiales bacterium]|nr:glycosyltransferase family 39 protein [Polyangiales bacterium]